MSLPASTDILIRIDTIDQLFNDPAINPFSDKTPVILGEAAIPSVIRQSLSGGLFGWHGKRLIIQLPADQINPELQPQVMNAVRKYAEAKQVSNSATIRISRWRSLRGLIFAFIIASVLLAFLVIITSTWLADSSDASKRYCNRFNHDFYLVNRVESVGQAGIRMDGSVAGKPHLTQDHPDGNHCATRANFC